MISTAESPRTAVLPFAELCDGAGLSKRLSGTFGFRIDKMCAVGISVTGSHRAPPRDQCRQIPEASIKSFGIVLTKRDLMRNPFAIDAIKRFLAHKMFFPLGRLDSYMVIATAEVLWRAVVMRCSLMNGSFVVLDHHR
jgi:hypothetical protein